MKVSGIIKNSVVNGIGIRDVLFVQGCTHHCDECHNMHTWDVNGGTAVSVEALTEIFVEGTNDITISGGEPLLQIAEVTDFMFLMSQLSDKRFWLYTGFTYEQVPIETWIALSKYVDVVVDGKFEKDKKDLKLQFRGSSNQRLIDLKKTIEANEVILWEGVHE